MRIFLRIGALGLLAGAAFFAFLLLKPVPETVKPIQPDGGTQYWTMAGGYRIAYRMIAASGGEAPLAPVIFLHGGPGGYVHTSIVETLGPLSQDGRDIYFYDQSGAGLSDRRPRPKDTTIAGHLADLDAIRRQAGADKVVLIGHSFGGLLAALYASEHPEHVERLILSSPGVIQPEKFDADGTPATARQYPPPAGMTFTPPQDYAEATSASRMPFRAMAAFTLAQLFDIKFIPDREMDAAVNTMASRFTRTMVCDPSHVKPEEGGAGGYSRVGTNYYPDDFKDPRPAMQQFAAPVMVLQGQCDFLSYGDAYEYAALFPNATYEYIPNAGHIIWWDRPEEYRRLIRTFLSEPVSGNENSGG